MKGVLYTLVTYLILSGLLLYATAASSANFEREKLVSEKISAERVFHGWSSIGKNLAGLLNMSVSKKDYSFTMTDTLPSTGDVSNVLQNYENFLKNYYNDPTLAYRFEDAAGNEISLQNIESEISLIPINFNYSWPNFGKNSGEFNGNSTTVKRVKSINMTMIVSPNIKDLGTIAWSGYKSCTGGTDDCLIFNLTVTDGTQTWTSDKDHFDLKFQAQLKVDLEGGSSWARATVGKIPTLINLDMQNANITHTTNVNFDTTDFFINYPAKLNVSTVFVKKVDWLQ